MRIRKMRQEDIIAVTRLHRNTIRTVNAVDYTPAQIKRWTGLITAPHLRRNFKFKLRYVAEDTDGTIAGIMNMSTSGTTLTRLFVHPRYRGTGVGSKLIKKAESIAREKGHKEIQLKSTKSAVTFYEKYGYHRVLHKPIVGGTAKIPVYHMKKRLT